MKFVPDIMQSSSDPEQLESLYQSALKQHEGGEFIADMMACHEAEPENLLFAAWYHRLRLDQARLQLRQARSTNWKIAIPLGILNGLIFWSISSEKLVFLDRLPYLILLWAPIAAFFVIGFLTFSGGEHRKYHAFISLGLAAACIYGLLLAKGQAKLYSTDYVNLLVLYLPLLAWVGTGLSVLGFRSSAENRFAFLIKSVEVFITAGLGAMAGGVFVVVTVGLFQALNLTIPETMMRLLVAGGAGLIPTLAVAMIYDPRLSPLMQDFSLGLSKIVATLLRLLLPMTLAVLVIYIFVIPFNFMQPFQNREVLIIYNGMLFAIMGLLIGATPVTLDDLSPRFQSALRAGILAVAILAVVISLYAMSATIYRTVQGGITINRLTIIGWNSINIGILVLAIAKLLRGDRQAWADQLKSAFKTGTIAYTVWTLVSLLSIPLLFN